MQFLVKRSPRNQVIFVVAGLIIAAALLCCFVSVLRALVPPVQRDVSPVIEQPHQRSVEQRKRDITRYLAATYKQHTEVVRMYVDLAFRESAKHPGVSPELAIAVMTKESSLIAHANNSYGAQGLMQVVRRWHPEKVRREESLLDPRVNVRVGTQILQQYIKEKGQIELALVKYSGNAPGYADFVMRQTKLLQAI